MQKQTRKENRPNKPKYAHKPVIKQDIFPKTEKLRISVADNFTQSHKIWRKGSTKAMKNDSPPQANYSAAKNQSI